MHDIALTGISFSSSPCCTRRSGTQAHRGISRPWRYCPLPRPMMKPDCPGLEYHCGADHKHSVLPGRTFFLASVLAFCPASVPMAYLGGSLTVHTAI